MITIHNHAFSFPEKDGSNSQEAIADQRLAIIVADAEGLLMGDDLLPGLQEQLELPRNGVLNALRRGAQACRLSYTEAMAQNSGSIGRSVIRIRSLDQPDL